MTESKKVVEFPSRESLYAQAAAWLVRLDGEPFTSAEAQELKGWACRSDLHRRALQDSARVWDRMNVMAGLSDLFDLKDVPEQLPWRSILKWPALAASLVCIGVLAWRFAGDTSLESAPVVAEARQVGPKLYETPIGGSDLVELEDGSSIRMNTATRIQVNMTKTRRDVVLLGGEAYFDVVRNEYVPFIVSVGDTRIQAVGTAFSVQKRVDRVEVTVTEGVVQVEQLDLLSADAMSASFKPMLLRAGQVAQVTQPGAAEIKEIEPQEMARKLMWQQKMLVFDGNTLQEVVDEYSRYTPFTIRIADVETATIRVGGYFRSDDVAGLLSSLEDNFAISVTPTGANSFELKRK